MKRRRHAYDLRLVGDNDEEEQHGGPDAHPLVQHEEGQAETSTVQSAPLRYTAKSYNTPVKIAIGPVRPIKIMGCPPSSAQTTQVMASLRMDSMILMLPWEY